MKLRTQILLAFLFTIVMVVTIVGYYFYQYVNDVELRKSSSQLKAVSYAKAGRINTVLKNKTFEFSILRKSPSINMELNRYLGSQDQLSQISLVSAIILAKDEMSGINRFLLLDGDGKLIISNAPGKNTKTDFADYDCVTKVISTSKLSTELRYNENDELVFCIAGYFRGGIILLLEYDISQFSSVTSEYTGLGKSGESSIFYWDNDSSMIYITPLRFYPKPMMVEAKNSEMYTLRKSYNQGIRVFYSWKDYRNKEVILSIAQTDVPGWHVLTKMDKTEVLSYIDELRQKTLTVAIVITLISSLLIFLISYFLLTPINELAMAAEQISEGDLSKRVLVQSKNEVGLLAASFNKMTDSLVTAQTDLQQKVKELDRSNKSLDKFAHVVSHDLKTPLNSIEGMANLMKLEYKSKLSESEMELIYRMQDTIKQAKGLIKSILDYSELNSRKGLEEQVNLNEVVKQVLKSLQVPHHINVLNISILPEIKIEKILVLQIFQNLISNAVKYMDKGEGFIKIAHQEEETNYLFTIQDNGKGIPKDKIKNIFEMFETGNVDKNYDSTGVGLAIVKNIIEQKGGKIWVESEEGKGTTFFFTLPK